MRIGQLARQAGVSTDTLRLYESLGLIRATRSANGYRDYPEGTGRLLGLIRTGQRLGFSLAQIAAVTADVNRMPEPERGAAITALLGAQLQRVEQQIDELIALRDDLRMRLQDGCPLAPARPMQRVAEEVRA